MRGKYKSKKERKKTLPRPNLPTVATGVNQEMPSEPNSSKKPDKRENPSVGFFKLIKSDHKFKVEVAAVVAGIAVLIVYGLQFRVMQQSVTIDQRPWVKISSETNPLKLGEAISAKVHIVNYGKTPAKSFVADFVVAKVLNGEKPIFDYNGGHMRFSVGMIYPNEPTDVTINRVDPNVKDSFALQPLTSQEVDDFTTHKIFFAVYGKITYTDFFRIAHWTHYCTFIVSPSPGTATAKTCTDYNDIDDN